MSNENIKEQILAAIANSKRQVTLFDYFIIESIWNSKGPTEELINHLKLCSQSPFLFRYMDNRAWLILLACFIECEYLEQAQSLLFNYLNTFGYKDIHSFFLVAKFAKENNVTNPEIEKSVLVWDTLTNPQNETNFRDFVINKKIAVGGNSGCQLGKSTGEDIDSNDIVIRFSNYPQNPEYIVDYGSKTNIWVRNSSESLVHKEDISGYEFVIWKDNFKHFEVRSNYLDIMYNYIVNYPNKLFIINESYYKSLADISSIDLPSAGCIVLWYLYQILGGFDNLDVYGFAFLNKDYNDSGHYYDNLNARLNVDHNLTLEINFLSELYKLKNKNEVL